MNYNVLSKRRSELMGVAIICILVCHWKECFEYHSLTVPRAAQYLAQGRCGVDIFFLLSGIGLYYSFTKNDNIIEFYKKRFSRLIPTYIAITLPYWIIRDLILDKNSLLVFLKDFTCISFFEKGVHRFWFVPSIILFYLLFPFLYNLIWKANWGKRGSPLIRCFFVVIIILVINVLLSRYLPFYNNIEIMLTRLPVFVVGIYLGNKAYRGVKVNALELLIAPVLYLLMYFLTHQRIVFYTLTSKLSGHYLSSLLGMIVIEVFLLTVRFSRKEKCVYYLA